MDETTSSNHDAVRVPLPPALVVAMAAAKDRKPAKIGLGGIAVLPDRLRQRNEGVIASLAESMAEIGLLNPITVRPQEGIGYYLVAGLHRLEAAKLLGWESIPATVVLDKDASADQVALIEIDENLMRAELSPAERRLHLVARKRHYEKLHPETRHGGDRKSSHRNQNSKDKPKAPRFTKDTAEKTGKSESSVQTEVAEAEAIGARALSAVAGTSLDKPGELAAMARLPPEKREELADRAAAGEAVSAKAEAPTPPTKTARAARAKKESDEEKRKAAEVKLAEEAAAAILIEIEETIVRLFFVTVENNHKYNGLPWYKILDALHQKLGLTARA